MRHFGNWVVSVVFVTVLAVPLVLLAAGFRPEAIENKDPAAFPLSDAGALFNRDLAADLDAYFEDALPVLDEAVQAKAWVHVQLGESPNPEVVFGREGWLFWSHTLNQPCLGAEEAAAFADIVARADAAVSATGRRLVIAIAPDKPSIYPEMMEARPDCVLETAANLGRLDVPGVLVTTWDEMAAAKDEGPLYLVLDTHWTFAGAAVHATAIVETLVPGAWQPDALVALGETEREGDLTTMMALPATETEIEYESRLDGLVTTKNTSPVLTTDGEPVAGLEANVVTTPGAPVTGSTVVLHDSYGWSLMPVIAPYFEEAVFLRRVSPAFSYLQPFLEKADTVVHTSVQRDLFAVVIDDDLAGQLVAAYERELPGMAVGVAETPDGIRLTVDAAAGSDPYVVVELEPGTATATVVAADHEHVLDSERPTLALYVPTGSVTIEVRSGSVSYRGVTVAPS